MAIKLQHSVFIHIPKTGGRWVSGRLLSCVTGAQSIGDPVYDAHHSPDTDLPVFAFIRHPITMLNSLWYHRSRSHGNRRHKPWNWQQDHELERECGSSNYFAFFKNVAERPEIVTRYYLDFVNKYPIHTFWKMEDIANELVFVLKMYNEVFDKESILSHENKKVGAGASNLPIISRPDLITTIVENESNFCKQFGYTANIK